MFGEDFGGAPRRHQDVVVDQKAGAGPIVFGMAEQFDAADAALRHFHVLALIFEQIPKGGNAAQVAAADEDGRPAVDEQYTFQTAHFFILQIAGAADDLFQAGRARFEHAAHGLALLAPVRLAGRIDEFRLGHST